MSFPYELFPRSWNWRRNKGESAELIANAQPLPVSHVSTEPRELNTMSNGLHVSTPAQQHSRRFRLLDRSRSQKGLHRFGLPKGGWWLYWTDIFHTMLNMPRYRFLLIFFAVYTFQYFFFALFYYPMTGECIIGMDNFGHALWFSASTASTIGYSELTPNPDCAIVNLFVVFHLIFSALVDYLMMGLVFARFAAPLPRAQTIRFSTHAVMYRLADGLWCLSFRVANIRKHSLMEPQVQLLLAIPDYTSSASYQFEELEIDNYKTQCVNMKLGLMATVNHIITPSSPLYELSLQEMEAREIEIVTFLDGIDPMTSNSLQARHSYTPGDIRMNERFAVIDLQTNRRGKLGLDFSDFDMTYAVPEDSPTPGAQDAQAVPPAANPNGGLSFNSARADHHAAELRSRSIRSLSPTCSAQGASGAMGAISMGGGPVDPLSAAYGNGAGRLHSHQDVLLQSSAVDAAMHLMGLGSAHMASAPGLPGRTHSGQQHHHHQQQGGSHSQAHHNQNLVLQHERLRVVKELCEAVLKDASCAGALRKHAGMVKDLLAAEGQASLLASAGSSPVRPGPSSQPPLALGSPNLLGSPVPSRGAQQQATPASPTAAVQASAQAPPPAVPLMPLMPTMPPLIPFGHAPATTGSGPLTSAGDSGSFPHQF